MSENINCPKVEIRSLGDNYGKVFPADLVGINKWSLAVRIPDGSIIDFSSENGFEKEVLEGGSNLSYNGYQLNLNTLLFDKNVVRNSLVDSIVDAPINNGGNV